MSRTDRFLLGLAFIVGIVALFSFTSAGSGLSNVQAVADIFWRVVSAIAIILGGIWAYFKFVVGRTFETNVEPELTGKVAKSDDEIYYQANVNAKNIGASRVDIDHERSSLRLFAAEPFSTTTAKSAEWTRLTTVPLLAHHDCLEPGEPGVDTYFFQIHNKGYIALMLEARVVPVVPREEEQFFWIGKTITGLIQDEDDNKGKEIEES